MEKRVQFYSEGLKLAGVLSVPDDAPARPRAGIVLCQGFSGIKDALLPDVARRLAQAGYVALTFDYRWFGESEGEPRWRVLPQAQVQDIRSAITFLQQQRAEVDPGAIGLYGTSFGGANVSYTAAVDPRVRCTVSTVGIGDGERWLRGLRRYWEWREFLARLAEDRRARVLAGRSAYVDTLEVMVPDPATRQFWDRTTPRALELFPHMGTRITLESADAVMEFKPETVVDRIAPRPILWIHAAEDALVPAEESRRMYERAGEPKKLVILEGLGHWDVYRGPGLEQVVGHALEWYRQWLPLDGAARAGAGPADR